MHGYRLLGISAGVSLHEEVLVDYGEASVDVDKVSPNKLISQGSFREPEGFLGNRRDLSGQLMTSKVIDILIWPLRTLPYEVV